MCIRDSSRPLLLHDPVPRFLPVTFLDINKFGAVKIIADDVRKVGYAPLRILARVQITTDLQQQIQGEEILVVTAFRQIDPSQQPGINIIGISFKVISKVLVDGEIGVGPCLLYTSNHTDGGRNDPQNGPSPDQNDGSAIFSGERRKDGR